MEVYRIKINSATGDFEMEEDVTKVDQPQLQKSFRETPTP